MIEKIYRYLKIFLSIYFVYFFIDYSISNLEKLKTLLFSSITTLVLIVFIKVLNILTNSLIFKKLVSLIGININFSTSQELTVLNNLGNFVGPMKLGSGMRIEYLRQNYKLNIKNFVLINFNFAIYTQIIFLSIFFITAYVSSRISLLLLLVLLTCLGISVIILKRKFIFRYVNLFYSEDLIKSALLNLSIFSIFFFGSLVVLMEANLVLNNSYSFFNSIFIFQGISLTNLVNLTPANLGVREFALTTINSLHNLNLNQLIEIGIIDRFCSITATFICFLIQNLIRLKSD